MALRALAAALACACASAAPAADEVTSLPGWDGALKSKMYSGFVNVSATMGQDMLVHYLYFEAESDPDAAPTVLWTNGGPGASSMFGIFVELGPYLLNANSMDGGDVPTLFDNPYGWTHLGSLLMFDWPPPVGFSYCGDPAGDGYSCGDWDDDRMANMSYAALQGWYELFPERKTNDLYLTGESYAGVYVPRLAKEILDGDDAGLQGVFKGFAVGDACVGTEILCGPRGGHGPWYEVIFFYGHGQFSTELYDNIVETCTMDYLKYGCIGKPSGCAPAGCSDLITEMRSSVAGYYGYNLYDDCIYQDDLRRRRLATAAIDGRDVGGGVNDYVCGGGDAQTAWVNNTAVREALHIQADALYFNGDNGDGMNYASTEADLMPFYQRVAADTDLRVLVYNGDADPGINSFVTQNWTSHLGYPRPERSPCPLRRPSKGRRRHSNPAKLLETRSSRGRDRTARDRRFEATQKWRGWTLDDCQRMGGYVTRYEKERFDFLTIRGSGHMVPQFKPAAALELLRAFLADEDYKTYNASCSAPP